MTTSGIRHREPARDRSRIWLGIVCFFAACGGIRSSDGADGTVIEERFRRLTRASIWVKAGEVPLTFRTYHPQGLARIGDRLFLSSVEVIDRGAGRGAGHLFEVSLEGNLQRKVELGTGAVYHPGGLDDDGRQLWVSVAEYRPESRSIVFQVDPVSLEPRRVFEFEDHLGAMVWDPPRQALVGVNWGSRRFYRWDLGNGGDEVPAPGSPVSRLNGGHYVDYQDGQNLPGTGYALFGGLGACEVGNSDQESVVVGGLELVDLLELRAVHQVPVMLRTKTGRSMLQNAWWVGSQGDGLRFYFIPEDEESTLYVYDVR